MKKKEPLEVDISKVVGLDNEERDDSVGYYQPFCLVLEDENNRQVQIFLDWDRLIDLAKLLKPYLEGYEAECKREDEWAKENEN